MSSAKNNALRLCEVLSCTTVLTSRQRSLCLAHKDQGQVPVWPIARGDVAATFVTQDDPRYDELVRVFPYWAALSRGDGEWTFGPMVDGMGEYEFLVGESALRRNHFEHEVYLISSPALAVITPGVLGYLGDEAQPGVRLYNVGISCAKASMARKRWSGHVASYRSGDHYGAEIMIEAMIANGVDPDFLTHVTLVRHFPAEPGAGLKARTLELKTMRGPAPTPDGVWCQHEGKQPPPLFHRKHLQSTWGPIMTASHPVHSIAAEPMPTSLHEQGVDPVKEIHRFFPGGPPRPGTMHTGRGIALVR